MGIIGMKVMARGRILSSWTPPPVEQQKRSWEGRGAIATTPGALTKRETFNYNLSLPISTAIIGCDSVEQVEECVELARSFTPLSQAQMAAVEAKVEPVAKQALFSGSCPAEDSRGTPIAFNHAENSVSFQQDFRHAYRSSSAPLQVVAALLERGPGTHV